MNRRGFISMLAGAAGTGVIGWRLPKRLIVLPSQQSIITVDASWLATTHHPLCNCQQCVAPLLTPAEILADMERGIAMVSRVHIPYLNGPEIPGPDTWRAWHETRRLS